MKIVSITAVKNESDIIESFVRYHQNIIDEMIILNNGSTDDTNYILDNLIKEGLPITVLNDTDRYFEPRIKYNCLLRKAFNEFNADIVCPLDVDEFITSDSTNPRHILENMVGLTYYSVKWRTYIPTENDDINIKFVPSRIQYIRDESWDTFYKVFLPKELFFEFPVRLSTGNHVLVFNDKYKDKVKNIDDSGLILAHFPLRSKEQTMSKVLVGYPNVRCRKNLQPGQSFHYNLMFNKRKNDEEVTNNDVTEFAKQYSLESNKNKNEFEIKNINILKKPMNLDFCKNISIKYSFKINPLKNVLENYLYLADEINKFKTEIDILNNKIQNVEKIKNNDINVLQDQLFLIKNNLFDKEKEIFDLQEEIIKFNNYFNK